MGKRKPKEVKEDSSLELVLQAEAIAELARRPRIEPVIIRFREPGPRGEDGMPLVKNGIVCDTRRYLARSGERSQVFDRGDGEALEEFEKRVEANLGTDGLFWLAVPELLQNSLQRDPAGESTGLKTID